VNRFNESITKDAIIATTDGEEAGTGGITRV
jgi:hypothetical protein